MYFWQHYYKSSIVAKTRVSRSTHTLALTGFRNNRMIFTDNLLPKGSATAPVTFVIDYIIFACHCTMNRLPFFIFFGIAGLISAGPRTTVSVVHSDGDGYISSRARISNYKETWVQSNGKVITWISFNLKGYKFARTRTCMLALHITAVKRSGICDFRVRKPGFKKVDQI